MAAYLIGRVKVTDPAQYAEYTKVTPGVIAQYGGEFVVRGGSSVTLEGPDEGIRIVVLRFPSMDDVKAFYDSPEYTAARKLREGAAIGQLVAVEGVPE